MSSHCNSTMSEPLQVKVSRDGKEIGIYQVDEALRLLASGDLKPTDHYWSDGMTAWALLSQLRTWDLGRKKAAAELKAKSEDDRLREERIRAEVTRRKENFFICNCCKARFERPYDPRDLFWKGLGIIFMGFLAGAAVFGSATTGHGAPPGFIIFCLVVVSVVLALWGSILVLSSGLRSPFCPGCHSTDYSRPNSDIRPVFE